MYYKAFEYSRHCVLAMCLKQQNIRMHATM